MVAHDGEVRASLEDDYHHFRVKVRHDGKVVTGVESESVRFPWAGCAVAGDDWSKFVGAPLEVRSSAIARYVEMRLYCTHMYELAGLAMSLAARKLPRRRYDMTAPYGTRRSEPAFLLRDGVEVLRWETDGFTVQSPEPFVGVVLRQGYAGWAEKNLDDDIGESALVLRRAVLISSGRGQNLDAMPHSKNHGGCYTTQPERAPTAYRVIGSTMDFENRPEELLRMDKGWLEASATDWSLETRRPGAQRHLLQIAR